jgi:hypothetical protein
MDFGYRNKSGMTGQYYLNGIYFGNSAFSLISSNTVPTNKSIRFLYFYLRETILNTATNFTNYKNKPSSNDIMIYSTDINGVKEINIADLQSSSTINFEIGQFFTFADDTWIKSYFPSDSDKIKNGIGNPTPITEVAYSTMVIFKK